MLTRKRILAAKIETTPGTAVSLSAADAGFNVYDAEITPNIPMSSRLAQGGFGQLQSVTEGYSCTVTFRTDLTGDGLGGVPAWASTFLPACGYVNSLGVFSPTAEAPGSNVKTLTIGVYKDGRLEQARGCAGTFKIMCPSGKPASIEFTFTGIWMAPTDVALISPTYPTVLPLRAASTTFTIGGAWSPCIENIEFDAGNSVILRECSTDASGFESGLITDRLVSGTLNPESSLVATKNNYQSWLDSTEEAISYSLSDGTDTFVISSSAYQITNIQPGDRGGNQIDNISFQVNDDSLQLEFA